MHSIVTYDNSMLQIKSKEHFLSTGCSKLDKFLRGGLLNKGITQIYGESGTGKTQLALQLCLTAQIKNDSSNYLYGAAYICTEAAFPSNRLQQLFEKSPIAKKHLISNEMIFIEHVSSTEDLEHCISSPERLPQLLSKYKIKLIVIDSIASTYRVEYESDNLKNRAKSLRNLGYHLHKLANKYDITVVCINQITAIIHKTPVEHISAKEKPSLGITWANMITNSLHMYRKNNRRYLYSEGSTYMPHQTIEFEISGSGVEAIDD
ncbi:DNA repair protein XRCC3-like [Phymastichus coffea]|uniref:DNA repair protein XRCC3-like n=1 Tax=Phymastichus coffea TaxID=108790 RepID=UPI00273BE361|nr:DNA repair protein XRCC3-like [Phymastichus coffea]